MLYVQKPKTIEAFQFNEKTTMADIPAWFINEHVTTKYKDKYILEAFEIKSEHGKTVANYGDYIIKDDNGELWVCPANDFEAEYDEVIAA